MSTPEGAKISNKAREKIVMNDVQQIKIEERNYIYNQSGEPSLLPHHESSNIEFGLQNAITTHNLACLINAR